MASSGEVVRFYRVNIPHPPSACRRIYKKLKKKKGLLLVCPLGATKEKHGRNTVLPLWIEKARDIAESDGLRAAF